MRAVTAIHHDNRGLYVQVDDRVYRPQIDTASQFQAGDSINVHRNGEYLLLRNEKATVAEIWQTDAMPADGLTPEAALKRQTPDA